MDGPKKGYEWKDNNGGNKVRGEEERHLSMEI